MDKHICKIMKEIEKELEKNVFPTRKSLTLELSPIPNSKSINAKQLSKLSNNSKTSSEIEYSNKINI